HEPVRNRGLTRAAAGENQHALAQLGRVAMELEAHLPERAARPVPAAAQRADALRTAPEKGAKAVRERRVPEWDAVREVLVQWDAEEAEERADGVER
ncbi:FUSC family protein, partial [Streptomyces sp. DT17]